PQTPNSELPNDHFDWNWTQVPKDFDPQPQPSKGLLDLDNSLSNPPTTNSLALHNSIAHGDFSDPIKLNYPIVHLADIEASVAVEVSTVTKPTTSNPSSEHQNRTQTKLGEKEFTLFLQLCTQLQKHVTFAAETTSDSATSECRIQRSCLQEMLGDIDSSCNALFGVYGQGVVSRHAAQSIEAVDHASVSLVTAIIFKVFQVCDTVLSCKELKNQGLMDLFLQKRLDFNLMQARIVMSKIDELTQGGSTVSRTVALVASYVETKFKAPFSKGSVKVSKRSAATPFQARSILYDGFRVTVIKKRPVLRYTEHQSNMAIVQSFDVPDVDQPTMIRPLKLCHGTEVEDGSTATPAKILGIIYKYRLTKAADAHDRWVEGTPKFLDIIDNFVRKAKPVQMCMPAFPFKSANKVYKVLGALPDRAEEAALEYMNTMCAEINAIYRPGAKLLVVSDGLVYNDLLTIPDREVWAYGQELRAMSAKRFPHIEFSRLRQLVAIDLPEQLDEVTYVANATNFRRALLTQFGRDGLDVHTLIQENEDTRLTFCGHSRFLTNDLRYIFPKSELRGSNQYKRDVKFLAREMIRRGFAFAAAIKHNFPDHLRLSIHQSTGEHKISLSLLPTKTSYTTPWMCAIAYAADGTLTSAPKGDFEHDHKYQLVHRDGRPSHFVERSESALSVLGDATGSKLNRANGSDPVKVNGSEGKGKTGGPPCEYCGKATHGVERCFDKYPHLAPKWVREKMASTMGNSTVSAGTAEKENAEDTGNGNGSGGVGRT
ncbi:MAG: hypothetical protein Q9184_007420, partial [Pyrenodesmia sp. 2 TL-2023]